MKKTLVLIIAFCALALNADLWMWPDYFNIEIPPNIAPLNFRVNGNGERSALMRSADGDVLSAAICGEVVRWKMPDWKRFLARHAGERVIVSVRCGNDTLCATNTISAHPINQSITYRLIPPGYTGFAPHGIYQRDLTTFEEKPIYRNVQGHTTQCVNCHTLNQADPEQAMFHARIYEGGTQIFSRKWGRRKVNLNAEGLIGSGAYPAWHPSGDFIAFSLNETRQGFWLDNPDKIEVVDSRSDMVLYSLADGKIIPIEVSNQIFETYPAWSPDGRWLFSASARTDFKEMPKDLPTRLSMVLKEPEKLQYDLVVRSFDPSTREFSAPKLVIDGKASNKSVSLPRVSPDGRWLVFTVGPYGNFHIWHHEADLWLLDLAMHKLRPLSEINSTNVESYHTFSHDGKWMVFSSRRDDGTYTRPYFTHFDATSGVFTKPFILPVEDPDEHIRRMLSYNVPEFVNGKVNVTPVEARKLVESQPR